MSSPYRDQILDLLADGNERTIEEIRKGISAPEGAHLHRLLEEIKESLVLHRAVYRLRSRRVSGKLYYTYSRSSFAREEKPLA